MLKICHFRKSVVLGANIDAVYEFHQNPENLRKISPASLQVIRIAAEPVAAAGGRFHLEAKQFGLPIRWTGEWETARAPSILVDVAIESPFKFFRHTHGFEAIAEGRTRMTDHVEYALPFGWAGYLAAISGGKIALELMFRERHRATVAWFEKNSRSQGA